MGNILYLEVYNKHEDYLKTKSLNLPLESFITYCIYRYCEPHDVILKFVYVDTGVDKDELILRDTESIDFENISDIPWQVAACIYPVILHKDTIITGLCAVARHISKYRTVAVSSQEHDEGLLSFRKGCLQAPNEVSIWTKFCEVDLIKTVRDVLQMETINELPINLVRFENHLNKPVKVHNVYKVARELKKEKQKENSDKSNNDIGLISKKPKDVINNSNKISRVPKQRNWKSHTKKINENNSSQRIEDLDLRHQYAEGPFFTLADLVLLPSYHILIQIHGEKTFESLLPLTWKWYMNIMQVKEIEPLYKILHGVEIKNIMIDNISVPATEDLSLYKCDPKRHNPKKRLFTKEDDIENALSIIMGGMELSVSDNNHDFGINWDHIPAGANPNAGHLPDDRMVRKSQQLENLTLAVLTIARDNDLIVDFCSGSGHLGILVAHLLPKCTVILLENKEQSLLRARNRVHDLGLKNVYFFQCNLDFFIGKFDIGIALHACGIASDLVLDKCLKANAKFVMCPCCYGSLHATNRLVYPRSNMFSGVSVDQYLCIGHAADQTHEDHPLTVRGERCMAVIDSDRARLAEEFGYKVTLSRLKPLSCTPKNNLLIGIPA